MKSKNERKRGAMGKKFSMNNDPFFEMKTNKRRKTEYEDDDIDSGDSEEDAEILGSEELKEEEQEEEEEETPGEFRKRVATELLDRIRGIARKGEEDNEEGEGVRDSLVAKILQQEQLEESGRVRRVLASR